MHRHLLLGTSLLTLRGFRISCSAETTLAAMAGMVWGMMTPPLMLPRPPSWSTTLELSVGPRHEEGDEAAEPAEEASCELGPSLGVALLIEEAYLVVEALLAEVRLPGGEGLLYAARLLSEVRLPLEGQLFNVVHLLSEGHLLGVVPFEEALMPWLPKRHATLLSMHFGPLALHRSCSRPLAPSLPSKGPRPMSLARPVGGTVAGRPL